MAISSNTTDTHRSAQAIGRRDFLKLAVGMGGVAVAAEFGLVGLAYFQPRLGAGDFGGAITVGKVDDFPPESVTLIKNGRFYLSRLADGGLLALYQRCTHLGCSVPWDAAQHKFICPCHSAEYDASGQVTAPPAPRSLDLFHVTVTDGVITVDTSRPVQRDRFDPAQVVYP
ncbi:MAG: Rieske 2Fe-2S domain-containing protein [Chloroflexi bacterium]|nr:Rieske 2Fe-2S domain-containing protein [Chloroflexota bacterium]